MPSSTVIVIGLSALALSAAILLSGRYQLHGGYRIDTLTGEVLECTHYESYLDEYHVSRTRYTMRLRCGPDGE